MEKTKDPVAELEVLAMIYSDVQVCATCKHYHQHYGEYNGGNIVYPLNCGHCTYPRMKTRRPGDVCEKWENKRGE